MTKIDPKIGYPADSELRRLLAKVIKQCPKSRDQIAEEMSVSKFMLDGWTAPSKNGVRFPAAFITSFCEATGNDQVARWVLGTRLRKVLELGERELEVRTLRKELLKTKRRTNATR